MTIDYDAIAQEASAAIAEAGFIAILRKETGGPSEPWDEGTATVTDSEVTVIDSGIRDRYIAGTLITRKTRTLIVAIGNGAVPEKADRIQVRGVFFEIEQVMPVAPGGVDLLFQIEIAI